MVKSKLRTEDRLGGPDAAIDPWWTDAPLLFPLVLGPLAFLATVLPGVEPILMGRGAEMHGLFLKASVRMLAFSVAGYILGALIQRMGLLMLPRKGRGIDVRVDDRTGRPPQSEAPQPESVSFPVAVEYLAPGMKLADPLVLPDGRQMAPQGGLLTPDMIRAVREAEVESLRIEGVRYRLPSDAGEERFDSEIDSQAELSER